MTDDLMERYRKQFDLIGKYEQAQEDNAALLKEQTDELIKNVETIRNSGIEVTYDRDSGVLTLPEQENGKTVDKLAETADFERQFLEHLLTTGEVLESGYARIDEALYTLSDALKASSPLIDSINELTGKRYGIEDVLDWRDSDSPLSKQARKELLAEKYPELSEREREKFSGDIVKLLSQIEEIFDGSVKTAWKALSDPNIVLANYIVTDDGKGIAGNTNGVPDVDGRKSLDDAHHETLQNIIDDTIKLHEENQKLDSDMLENQKKIHSAWKAILDTLAEVVERSNQSIDDLQNVYATLKEGAKEFSETGGYLSIDTYQKILDLGPQYMQFLIDENGQWAINEERIRAVMAARVEQLAYDKAWTYVESVKVALAKDDTEQLEELLTVTHGLTEANWGLIYSEIAGLKLSKEYIDIVTETVNKYRDIMAGASAGIGILSDTSADGIDSMRDSLNDLVNYVMEMLKQKVEDQIKDIEDMKDAYGELIEAKKESLRATKDEESYERKRSKQLKEIAKLQARIDMLSLDSSREAQAEKKKLLEEMAQLQESLSDTQADYAVDQQEDALDKMKDAYEKEKDGEIDELKKTISSKQKLWEQAIDYIRLYWETNWDALRDELLQWNYDVGSDLEENLVSAWENATAAAQRYGDFVSAMDAMKNTGGGSDSGDYGEEFERLRFKMKQNSLDYYVNDQAWKEDHVRENQDIAARIEELTGKRVYRSQGGWWAMDGYGQLYDITVGELVARMKQNSGKWFNAGASERTEMRKDNDYMASLIQRSIGQKVYLNGDGVWVLGDGRRLYEATELFGENVYHSGGRVGEAGSLKDNEVMAKLEKGEAVLTHRMWENAVETVEKLTKLSSAIRAAGPAGFAPIDGFRRSLELMRPNAVTNITNDTRPVDITFGDTVINGADPDAVERHRAVSREMMNEIARWIRRP